MRQLTDLLAAARADLAGVPRRFWVTLALLVAAEVIGAVVVLKLLS